MSWKPCRGSGMIFEKKFKKEAELRELFYNHEYFLKPNFENLKEITGIAYQ